VTRRRARAVSGKTYSPDRPLIRRYSATYGWKEENLVAVLSEFGPLPEVAQEQLIKRLVVALGHYKLRAHTKERVTPGKQSKLLKAVEKASKRLLLHLGINVKNVAPRAMWERSTDLPPSARVPTLGRQSPLGMMVNSLLCQARVRPADRGATSGNTELREASDDVANSIIGLLHLHDRAKEVVQAATPRTTPKRGGPRHVPSARGSLTREAIEIYGRIRAQYPDSGNKPGLGEPMRKFVRAVGALFDVSIDDSQVNEGWRHRKSNQNLF
jgi:hypothetical protein